MDVKNKILIVEDDEDIREVITILLEREGYETLQAADGQTALERMKDRPDLILLDVMLPDMSGIDVCRKIRETSVAPILFLTAKGGLQDKTEGLQAGGDDYLVKPFFQEELLARVAALLRRYEQYKGKVWEEPREKYLQIGRIRVNEEFNEVFKDDKAVELPNIEYKILKLLMRYHNKIFSIQNIYESVWENPYFYDANNIVMVHIRKLRMAIEDDPRHPAFIRTEWGRGYRFVSKEKDTK